MKLVNGLACLVALVMPCSGASRSNIAIDPQGNIWQTGQNLTVPLTANAFQKTQAGSSCGTQQLSPFDSPTALACPHAYVTRQDPAGHILYATYLGGNAADGGIAITTDAQGNAYVTGFTNSADFPVTAGVIQPRNAGPLQPTVVLNSIEPFGPKAVLPGGDIFLAKFAPDGTLLYSTLLGGSGSDIPNLIAVDSTGAVSIAGTTGSSDFPVTADSLSHQNGNTNFFVRLNPQATAAIWATYSDSPIQSFDIDAQGNAFLTGNSTAGPYVTKVSTGAGRVGYTTSLSNLNARFTGAGAAISVIPASGEAVVAVSPAPMPPAFFLPVSQSVYPLGASFLLTLSADGASILAETDIANTQFDQLLQDAAGNVFAVGHGTGSLPSAATPALLTSPCSSAGGSFSIELNSAGGITAATYLRQGTAPATINASGQLTTYRAVSQTAVAANLAAQPSLNFSCLQNLASGTVGQGIAQGEIFVLFGNSLGPAQSVAGTADASGHFPTSLAGVQVLINGNPAPLLMVQAGEIHGVVPFAFGPQVLTVQVQYLNQSAPILDEPAFYNPGIFATSGQGAILNQDGTVNTPSNPAKLGSVVSIYGTGEGPFTSPVTDGEIIPLPPPYIVLQNAPQVVFAGINGTVLWAGAAPELIAGVTQLNVRIPAALPSGTNLAAVPVIVVSPGAFSPSAAISLTQ